MKYRDFSIGYLSEIFCFSLLVIPIRQGYGTQSGKAVGKAPHPHGTMLPPRDAETWSKK